MLVICFNGEEKKNSVVFLPIGLALLIEVTGVKSTNHCPVWEPDVTIPHGV